MSVPFRVILSQPIQEWATILHSFYEIVGRTGLGPALTASQMQYLNQLGHLPVLSISYFTTEDTLINLKYNDRYSLSHNREYSVNPKNNLTNNLTEIKLTYAKQKKLIVTQMGFEPTYLTESAWKADDSTTSSSALSDYPCFTTRVIKNDILFMRESA